LGCIANAKQVMGFLKFLLILMAILYFFRVFIPFSIQYLLKKWSKKMQQSPAEGFSSSSQEEPKKNTDKMGEYIDYEEID
jgi:hypothetical protein